MFTPDKTSEAAAMSAALTATQDIFDLQNENRNPSGGTLAFTMGTAIALGELAAVYVQDGTPEQKADFLKIITDLLHDTFQEPSATTEVARTLPGLPH